MSSGGKTTYIYKRFRVQAAAGQSTTVSVDPILVVRACQSLGSLASVSQAVREAASSFETAPCGKNRSAHVSQKLQEIVARGRVSPQASAPDNNAVG